MIEGEPSAASTDDTHTQPFSYSRTNEECEGKKCLELVFVPKGFTLSLYFYFILFVVVVVVVAANYPSIAQQVSFIPRV